MAAELEVGVPMGPLSATNTQPRPFGRFFRDSAWFLKNTRILMARRTDGRNRATPQAPWFFEQETATELDFRFFAVSIKQLGQRALAFVLVEGRC